jgi:arginine repressor
LDEEGNDQLERDVSAEVAMFHDAIYEPTEKTITLLVKSLVRRGDAAGAEALLDNIAVRHCLSAVVDDDLALCILLELSRFEYRMGHLGI